MLEKLYKTNNENIGNFLPITIGRNTYSATTIR